MRLFLSLLALASLGLAAEPFEIKDGDRVLFLGDALLERENTYGYLETRLHEQFPDRTFTVRNLSWAGDTPAGISRASFDPADTGLARLREHLDLVKPTVVFLGYGMAASLQEMTDRSRDWTLNPDAARYGEPMSAARFKRELAALVDLISGRVGVPPAGSGVSPEASSKAPGGTPGAAGGTPTLPGNVRFVLLSPIRHEDLRAIRPGLPDPAEHNKLLEQYTQAVIDLAKERGAEFVPLMMLSVVLGHGSTPSSRQCTLDGIHLTATGHHWMTTAVVGHAKGKRKDISFEELMRESREPVNESKHYPAALRAAILRKNDLFFHRFRPANSTYLFGFRKHEQGQNAKEMAEFDPIVAAADAEIDRLKRAAGKKTGAAAPSGGAPATSGGIPASSGGLPAASGGLPAPSGGLPAASGVIAAPRGEAPVASGVVAAPRGGAPAASGVVTAPRGEAPATSGEAPATSGELPVPRGGAVPPSSAAAVRLKQQAAPLTPLPLPTFDLDPTLEITLWADSPLLGKPTQMAWDAAGRLWVACTPIYPQIEPGAHPDDKVVILEDTDRDGKADKSTTFIDDLLIPSGIAVANDEWRMTNDEKSAPAGSSSSGIRHPSLRAAAYVAASTELLRLEDSDGDGKADSRRVVLAGFGTEDTHHNLHTLRWGPDGRLYMNQSIYTHSHIETPWGMVRLNAGGCLAYDPRTERVEVFMQGLWNPWGHAWDKWGQSFFTDGAGFAGLAWAFPGAVFNPSEGSRKQMPTISPGTYPKFAGLEIVHSPLFPADWQGTAVTCDFRAHRIVRFAIEDLVPGRVGVPPAGSGVPPESTSKAPGGTPGAAGGTPTLPGTKSGYVTRELPDVARTADLAFRPIDVRLGPDGALYLADWTNPVINHGEVDFRDPRRDHVHGRIWRVAPKGGKGLASSPKVPEMDKQDVRARAIQVRGTAAEAAVQRRHVHADLRKEIEKLNKMSAQAEEVMKLLQAGKSAEAKRVFEEAKKAGLIVEMCATGLPEAWHAAFDGPTAPLHPFASDANPRVRVEAMRGLALCPTPKSAALVLAAALNAPADDPHYEFAAWRSINDLAEVWTEALAKGEWVADSPEKEKQLAWGLGAIRPELASGALAKLLAAGKLPLDGTGPWLELLGKAGDAAALQRLWEPIVVGYAGDCCENDATRALTEKVRGFPSEPVAKRALAALLDAARTRGARPAAGLDFAPVLFHASEPWRTGAVELAGLWKSPGTLEKIPELLGEPDLAPATRRAVFKTLRALDARALLEAQSSAPGPNQRDAVLALAALDFKKAAAHFPAVLASADDAMWRELLAIKGAPDALAAAFPKDVPPDRALKIAREIGRPGAKLVAALSNRPDTSNATYAGPAPDIVKRDGDPARGEEIYRRAALACVTCHAIGGAGGKVGPELGTIGASAPLDYIIESLYAPNAKVKEGYNAVSLTLKDGTVAAGVLARESEKDFILRNAIGVEQSVPKANVTTRENIGSLMPPGLLANLQPREHVDLAAFLAQLGKAGVYDASKATTARTWWVFTANDVVGSVSSLKPGDATPKVFTNVDGRLPRERLAESGAAFLATKLNAATAAKTKLTLAGIREAWLDGQPLPVASEPNPTVELSAGDHLLIIKLDAKSLPDSIRAESGEGRFLAE